MGEVGILLLSRYKIARSMSGNGLLNDTLAGSYRCCDMCLCQRDHASDRAKPEARVKYFGLFSRDYTYHIVG